MLVTLPLALGPATTTITRWLGGELDHKCMCGMKRGTCGCPECEKLEQMRQHDREHAPKVPIVKRSCDSDDEAVSSFGPPAVLPSMIAVAQATNVDRAPISYPPRLRSIEQTPPPTPPPRAASV